MPGVLRLSATTAMAILRRSASAVHRSNVMRCHTRSQSTKPATPTESDQITELRRSFDRDTAAGHVVPVFKRALLYGDKPAIKDTDGEYTYGQLYASAKGLSGQLSNLCGE